MKSYKYLIILLAAALMLSACSSGAETLSGPVAQVVPGGPAEKDEPAQEMQRVGEENYGFWDIPSSWQPFTELDAHPDDIMIQYSDPTGSQIITVRYFEDFGSSPEEVLNSQGAYMESLGGEGIQGARVSLNGIEAIQIYGFFPEETAMVTWAFESGENLLHVIIAEGPIPEIFDTVGYLEKSYAILE